MNDAQLLDLLETRLRMVSPEFYVVVLPYEYAAAMADALARLREGATQATAWNPAGVPAHAYYDVPAQTVAEILEEYERDWAAERAADEECNEGAYCPICDTDE